MILGTKQHIRLNSSIQIPTINRVLTPPVKTHLFINYYKPLNIQRSTEIDTCIFLNVSNPDIDHVFILYDITLSLPSSIEPYMSKITKIDYSERMTYKDMVSIVNEHSSDDIVSIFCNSDMILGDVQRIKDYLDKNMVFAITRYNITKPIQTRDDILTAHAPYSFGWDTWAIRGSYNIPLKELDIHFGTLGCDSKFNYILYTNKYQVLNPYKYIKTYHYHLSNIRNYTGKDVKQSPERIEYKPNTFFQLCFL